MCLNLTPEFLLFRGYQAFTCKISVISYLLEKEVISQVIQHHWVTRINCVSPREELNTILDGISLNETLTGISSISVSYYQYLITIFKTIFQSRLLKISDITIVSSKKKVNSAISVSSCSTQVENGKWSCHTGMEKGRAGLSRKKKKAKKPQKT